MAHQYTKKVAVSVLTMVSALAFAGAAQAGCNGTVCHSSSHPAYNPPALSSWSSNHVHAARVSTPTYSSSSVSYAAAPSYGSGSSSISRYSSGVSTAACPTGSSKQSDGTCLLNGSSSFSSSSVFSSAPTVSSNYQSGSISSTYSDYSVAPLTSSVLFGLGSNESLQATTCPVSVHNPSGAKVLGCYNVVKPKPVVRTVVRTVPTVYRVVRPIVYVRYPVPVCNTCCTPETVYSRYGGPVSNGAQSFGNRCGW